jgi:hypothetical protein
MPKGLFILNSISLQQTASCESNLSNLFSVGQEILLLSSRLSHFPKYCHFTISQRIWNVTVIIITRDSKISLKSIFLSKLSKTDFLTNLFLYPTIKTQPQGDRIQPQLHFYFCFIVINALKKKTCLYEYVDKEVYYSNILFYFYKLLISNSSQIRSKINF